LVLDDPTVSTDHARLERHGAIFMVEDLNSRNGITLNGQPLPPNRLYPLNAGDRVQICDFVLEMAAAPAPALAPEPAAPEPFPAAFAGFELRKVYAPRDVVGGDFFVSKTLDANRLAVAVGDATGAARPPAEVTPRCAEAVRRLAVPEAGPRDVAAGLQRALAEMQAGGRVTLLYGILDGRDASFRYANAGHVPPVVYHRSRPEQIRKILVRGEPLGSEPAAPPEEKRIALEAGEVMILLTDGVVDAFPRGGADETTLKNGIREVLVQSWHLDFKGFVEAVKRKIADAEAAAAPFGYEGVAAVVARHGAAGVRVLLPALHEAVVRHAGSQDPGDDLTLIGFERTR
ncbi:MAG: SpoIIE family protein phosphatase, partial [Planctomycetes bacterium]|nr:SpoIIE family protein phosphatase [Planctomycetota bacterium]